MARVLLIEDNVLSKIWHNLLEDHEVLQALGTERAALFSKKAVDLVLLNIMLQEEIEDQVLGGSPLRVRCRLS